MSREILERLKAQIAEQMRIHGENARDSSYLKTNALPVIERQILANAIDTNDITLLVPLFPVWEPDMVVTVPQVLSWDGALYEVLQAHTTQIGWEPHTVPALFKVHSPPGIIPDWIQPINAETSYSIDDEVKHDNPNDGGNIWVYRSKINANATEPGRDGTFDRWWEPVRLY